MPARHYGMQPAAVELFTARVSVRKAAERLGVSARHLYKCTRGQCLPQPAALTGLPTLLERPADQVWTAEVLERCQNRPPRSPRVNRAVVTLVAGLVAGCHSGADQPAAPTADQLRATCLYEAVGAYPTWPADRGNVLDALTACRTLPAEDRELLRRMAGQFVQAANERATASP